MDEDLGDTEWRFFTERRRPGGLILTFIRHMDHLLAYDVRVPSLWVGSATGPPSKPLVLSARRQLILGSPECPFNDGPAMIPMVTLKLLAPFQPPFGRLATFRTAGPVLGDALTSPLEIEQRFLFTHYGIDPPHEPGALAWAARFYPLLSFRYPKTKQGSPTFNYLRADFRIAIAVEQVTNLQPGKGGGGVRAAGGSENSNSAGIFTDGEAVGKMTLDEIFARIEKPLRWEVLGVGQDWSQVGGRGDWDNIHQWPTAEGLPSTPGAPHAAHFHWRWGFAATQHFKPTIKFGPPRPFDGTFAADETPFTLPKFLSPELAPAAGKQFEGYMGPSTAVLDPRVQLQRLSFAITRFRKGSDPKTWAPDAEPPPSRPTFSDLFIDGRKDSQGKTSVPESLTNGAPLVWWLSFEAYRAPSNDAWEGTLNVPGIFFTHSAYPLELEVGRFLGGLGAEATKGTTTARQWWRPAPPKDKI